MRWPGEHGFHCAGLERFPDLTALAREHSSLPVIVAEFESVDLSRMKMDAILLIGALVHLPHELFPEVLSHILKALKPEGLVLITMKQRLSRQESDDGRIIFLYEKAQLYRVFSDSDLIILDFSVQTSSIRKTDIWLSFVLQKQAA